MANYCDKCGNKLKPGAKFCDSCGTATKQNKNLFIENSRLSLIPFYI